MTYVDPAPPPNVGEIPAAFRYIQWGPVIAGALLAAALASVLHTFAAAIGLSMSSTSPTWRDTSFVLVLLSGLYLLLVAFVVCLAIYANCLPVLQHLPRSPLLPRCLRSLSPKRQLANPSSLHRRNPRPLRSVQQRLGSRSFAAVALAG